MNTQQLRIEIVESRNLLQSDGKIHNKAVGWIANLEAHVQRELGRIAAYGPAQPPLPG